MLETGVARTFQAPKIVDECSVRENVMLGGHKLMNAGMLRVAVGTPRARSEERQLRLRAEDALARSGYEGEGTTEGGSLSFAERRKVELARCLIAEPELILLDEPTSGLDKAEIEFLLGVVRTLNQAGTTFVLVEHNVPVVAEMCRNVAVMVMGELVTSGRTDVVVRDPRVVAAYLGSGGSGSGKEGVPEEAVSPRPAPQVTPKPKEPRQPDRTSQSGAHASGHVPPDSSEVRADLSIRDLHAGYGQLEVLRGVSLTAQAGQVLLVMGRNGVGKSTLFNALAGLVRSRRGSIIWRGASLERRSPRTRMRYGLGLVPQGGGVIRGQTVRENLQLSLIGTRAGRSEVRDRIAQVFELFPSLADRQRENGGNLSGGERQMLAIAKVLVKKPSLLLLDEPSIGLAPRVLEELNTLVKTLRATGMAVCIAEQNIGWCRDLVEHALHLEDGRVAEVVSHDRLKDEAQVALLYLGNRATRV